MFLRAITTLSQIFTTTGSTREVPGLLARCYNGAPLCAGVAELVDAPDSKSGSFTGVSVRFRPSVPSLVVGKKFDRPLLLIFSSEFNIVREGILETR